MRTEEKRVEANPMTVPSQATNLLKKLCLDPHDGGKPGNELVKKNMGCADRAKRQTC